MKKILGINELKSVLENTPRGSDSSNEMIQDGILKLFGKKMTVSELCLEILGDIEKNGDSSLRKLCEKLDGSTLEYFEVSEVKINESLKKISPEIIKSMEVAADRIRDFQLKLESNFMMYFDEEKYPVDIFYTIDELFVMQIEVQKFMLTVQGISARLHQ